MNTTLLQTTVLLALSNLFMTVAWYAHLWQPVGLYSSRALLPESDGCKARRAGNGHSLAKRRNAADALSGHNPEGRAAAGRIAALRAACCGRHNGASRALHCAPQRPGAHGE